MGRGVVPAAGPLARRSRDGYREGPFTPRAPAAAGPVRAPSSARFFSERPLLPASSPRVRPGSAGSSGSGSSGPVLRCVSDDRTFSFGFFFFFLNFRLIGFPSPAQCGPLRPASLRFPHRPCGRRGSRRPGVSRAVALRSAGGAQLLFVLGHPETFWFCSGGFWVRPVILPGVRGHVLSPSRLFPAQC